MITRILPVDEKYGKLRKHHPLVTGAIAEMMPALTCQDGYSTLIYINRHKYIPFGYGCVRDPQKE